MDSQHTIEDLARYVLESNGGYYPDGFLKLIPTEFGSIDLKALNGETILDLSKRFDLEVYFPVQAQMMQLLGYEPAKAKRPENMKEWLAVASATPGTLAPDVEVKKREIQFLASVGMGIVEPVVAARLLVSLAI